MRLACDKLAYTFNLRFGFFVICQLFLPHTVITDHYSTNVCWCWLFFGILEVEVIVKLNSWNIMTLAEEFEWRGFINQTTFAANEDINEPRTFYWGKDPSADSMTIGKTGTCHDDSSPY